MKFITNYKEFDDDEKESILDHLLNEPMENKDIVLRYLKNGKYNGVRCSSIFDYVQNEQTFAPVSFFTDGEYSWDSEEIYHFEKHNMEINKDFINKVLS